MKEGKERIDFKYNFNIYLSLLKRYKFLFILLSLLILVTEATKVIDRFLFKIIIDRGTEYAEGTLIQSSFVQILIIIAIVFISVLMFRAISSWLNLHMINNLELNLIKDLKEKYFNHLVELDHKFHITHKTGQLISRLVRGGSSVETMTDVFAFNWFPMIFQLAVVTISIIYFSLATTIVILLTLILFIVYSLFIQKIQEDSNIKANKTEDIEKGNIAYMFTNIDSIKYFGKENIAKKKFLNLAENTKNNFLKNWNYFRWMNSGQGLIIGIGTLFVLYFSIIQFLRGEITLGTLAFLYTSYGGLVNMLFGFVHGIRTFYRAMAGFQDLFEYGKINKEIINKKDAKGMTIRKGEVEFKNVSFSYGNRELFDKFNLKIDSGKKIALVGHSGCGKTTLVKLLYRFYDVNKGAILVDGKDIRNVTQESLREEMSIVPQECILFDDTIYNNIAFSKITATREEVLKAIKFAQLNKTISQFPDGENTIVGERGVKLSSGEKQRVSIARALLADKRILVLDEATSSLDSHTEHEIQKDLIKLMKGRTSIIIAHRLSTIMHADIIIVMKEGKIVQRGKHNDLIRRKGEYKNLWNLQKGGYIK